MSNYGWWSPELVKEVLSKPATKYKYLVTDDKNDFIERMERININHHKKYGDNLEYLEELVRIQLMKDGIEPEALYDFLKDR